MKLELARRELSTLEGRHRQLEARLDSIENDAEHARLADELEALSRVVMRMRSNIVDIERDYSR